MNHEVFNTIWDGSLSTICVLSPFIAGFLYFKYGAQHERSAALNSLSKDDRVGLAFEVFYLSSFTWTAGLLFGKGFFH
jgi:hypothetical protein